MAGPFYFAWTAPDELWSSSVLREDEAIFAIELRQVEGDFCTLQIDLVNPRVGLLAAGRGLWSWLSWTPAGGDAMPIFRGRLVGVPENLQDEVVRLQFIARPADYNAQKAAVAATLQVAPYWDPVWLKDKVDDPDTVLESRPVLWHIDRVTLAVSVSDIIDGEDGTVDVTEADHFYDAMTVSYGQTPLREVTVTGTVTWAQTGDGTVDLTPPLIAAFQNSGSPLGSPLIASLTSDGLLSSWPSPGSNIGGGWSVGIDSSIVKADWIKPAFHKVVYTDIDPFPVPPLPTNDVTAPSVWVYPDSWYFPTPINNLRTLLGGNAAVKTWGIVFPVTPLSVQLMADWIANRNRSETVTFTLSADVQPIITDPGSDESTALTYSSDVIGQAVDPGGAVPLGDPGLASYFKSDRGVQSFEYLVTLARAKLLARARCVIVKFVAPWDLVIPWISCRINVKLFDGRLPGGGVIGKVTGYVLTFSDQGIAAEVTLGCTVGRGNTVQGSPGDPTYAEAGYIDGPTYTSFINGQIDLVPGEITYLSLDNFDILDDGANLQGLTASSALQPTLAVSLSTRCTTILGSTTVLRLGPIDGLENGGLYAIDDGGHGFIQPGSLFTFDGTSGGTLSVGASAHGDGIDVTISRAASNGITVINGLADQVNAVNQAARVTAMPDPLGALKRLPTTVCLELRSLDGGSFNTTFPMQLSQLMVPKTIDLEAA